MAPVLGIFFAVGGRRSAPTTDDGVYHGVDPLSAPDIAEGRGRIPLPSICSPASPLVTGNLFVSMPAIRARVRASASCPDRLKRRRRMDGARQQSNRGAASPGMIWRGDPCTYRRKGGPSEPTTGRRRSGKFRAACPSSAIKIRTQTVRRAADSRRLYRRRGSCNLNQ